MEQNSFNMKLFSWAHNGLQITILGRISKFTIQNFFNDNGEYDRYAMIMFFLFIYFFLRSKWKIKTTKSIHLYSTDKIQLLPFFFLFFLIIFEWAFLHFRIIRLQTIYHCSKLYIGIFMIVMFVCVAHRFQNVLWILFIFFFCSTWMTAGRFAFDLIMQKKKVMKNRDKHNLWRVAVYNKT